jgi:hypothetical protein
VIRDSLRHSLGSYVFLHRAGGQGVIPGHSLPPARDVRSCRLGPLIDPGKSFKPFVQLLVAGIELGYAMVLREPLDDVLGRRPGGDPAGIIGSQRLRAARRAS